MLWDRALCLLLSLVLEQAGAQGGSSPGMGAHTSGRHTWPTSRNFQALRWDTAGCGQPGRCQPGRLAERPCCPWCVFTASLSGQASASEPADEDVSDCFPHTAGFPPTEENPGKCLPTKRAASEQRTRPPKGHEVTSWSVTWGQLPPTRRGNVGQGPHRGTTQASLFKRSKSQQAECVPKPSEKSKAFRNGFNYSEAAKQGSLP